MDGVYPKDFKFTGWHPQCRCVSIPKLASVDEMLEYQEKVLNDEDVSNYHFKGEVRNMSKNFSDWWGDNQKRIMASSSLPYWVRDNKKIIGRKKTDVDVLKGTKNKSQEDIELEKILGVSKGKPMTFQQANEMKGNPHYLQGSYSGYTINCQSCVVANELRRRGFDVEAMMNTRHRDNLSYKLSKSTEKAWIDPIVFKTGELKTALGEDGILNIIKEKIDWKGFNEFTNEVGRYHVSFTWKNGAGGHVIVFERLSNGKHKWYDPQTGETNFFTASYINQILGNLRVYRVDNLKLNPEFSGVVAKAGTTKPNKIKYAKKQGGWFETDGADNVKPKNPLTEEQKKRRDEIFEYAKKNMKNIEIKHPQLNEPIKLYTKSIKEWLNQPHKYYFDKNEMLLNIKNVLSKSKYVGVSNYKDRISHIFEVELKGEKSWIIVGDDKIKGVFIHSISGKESILKGIKKTT